MKQESLSDMEYRCRKKKTKREEFLEIMDEIIPWDEWVGIIRPYYPAGKRGRPPIEIEIMLRMYLLQCWFSLSDKGVEDAIYDSYAMRKFMGINFFEQDVPDATTLLHFRHLLEEYGISTVAALGDYYLNRSGMVDMPDAWKPAIDVQALGKHIAGLEQGAFTEYGYIVRSSDEWRRVYEGQIVPEEYRVLSFPPPQVERDEASRPQREQTAPASQPVIPIVLNGKNNAERMKEITDKLEAGIQALFESEQYKNYLTAMSKFHNYSFNNTLLIAMQKPDASLVAGYNKWKDDFERHVKRGEKAIKILAPTRNAA